MVNPAVEWLEEQADAYHAAHQDPALRGALPPVPAYLRQSGGQERDEVEASRG